MELAASETVDKKDCYKVKATCANGTVRLLYYDKQTFLQLREDKATSETGGFSTTYLSNHKKHGGLTYPTDITFGEGKKMQKATLVKLLVNEKVSEEDFK